MAYPVRTIDLPILGMHCAACAGRIEKALAATPGVSEANVNFATSRASIRFDPALATPEQLRSAIQHEGYDAVISELPDDETFARIEQAEYRAVRTRFEIAAIL